MSDTRADGWGGDGTAHALEWLNLGEKNGMDESRRGQGLGKDAGRMIEYSKGDIGVGVYLGYRRGWEDGDIRHRS